MRTRKHVNPTAIGWLRTNKSKKCKTQIGSLNAEATKT